MVETLPVFGVQLMRLAELRGVDVDSLARRAAVPEPVITAVLDGGEPDPSLLCRLAPALGLHASDVFVIAGQRVPDDLAPLDLAAANDMESLAWDLTYLPRAVPELHQLVRSLPQQPRPRRPSAPTPPYQQYPGSTGGLVVRLLHNRNLGWSGSAKYLFGVGRRDALSASTIGAIGHGRKPLTPDLRAGMRLPRWAGARASPPPAEPDRLSVLRHDPSGHNIRCRRRVARRDDQQRDCRALGPSVLGQDHGRQGNG
jgi:hypothetical protein